MSESANESPSFFARRPVVATAALIAMIAGPGAVVMLVVGAPPIAVVATVAVVALLMGYLAYRTVRHPDDPGTLLRFFQNVTGYFTDY